MITQTYGGALYGVDAQLISIEVNIVQGTNLYVVGLPDSSIKESQHRIESVLKTIHCEMPRQRIIVNLAPADIKKEGSLYDLPIALCILHSSYQYYFNNLDQCLILGELALDGTLRPIKGVLSMAIMAKNNGLKYFILPEQNANEASIVEGLNVIPVKNIHEAIDFLIGKKIIDPVFNNIETFINKENDIYDIDLSDVQGQNSAKRALEIAASGGHNLIMIGSPGSGKTMLAQRISTILPKMTVEECLETTKIYSISSNINGVITKRPFRSPHHTISDVALVGGGSIPQPGEISLAHNGVLFLDELPEFSRSVLEVMRQPLEDRKVNISRTKMTVNYPCNFMLIASMNPCPCGYFNDPNKECNCTNYQIQRYISKISGPLLDRIDIHINILPVNYDSISCRRPSVKSSEVQQRVEKARNRQLERFKKMNITNIYTNSMMTPNMIKEICVISEDGNLMLKNAMEKLNLSARAYSKILKLSRTIADLEDSDDIKEDHIAEAIQYRSLDRKNCGDRY